MNNMGGTTNPDGQVLILSLLLRNACITNDNY